MTRHLALGIALAISVCIFYPASASAQAGWLFQPSYFSHDTATGARVAQYSPSKTAYRRDDGTYLQSGYRHNTMRLLGPDGSSDNMHVVETWGEGDRIRPYGEWLRPFREGATPYGPWGNPQGPWTTPYDSWNNPYGLGQIPQNIYHYFPGDQRGGGDRGAGGRGGYGRGPGQGSGGYRGQGRGGYSDGPGD